VKVDDIGVMERIETLFEGHADLIIGFNQFLPPGLELEVSTDWPIPSRCRKNLT
jgi:histone deacetylase complex regulatory component SIN3